MTGTLASRNMGSRVQDTARSLPFSRQEAQVGSLSGLREHIPGTGHVQGPRGSSEQESRGQPHNPERAAASDISTFHPCRRSRDQAGAQGPP